MATKHEQIEEIHNSLVNGQRQQMVAQIDNYELYDFWAEYGEYLEQMYTDPKSRFAYFADTVISYHRIKNR